MEFEIDESATESWLIEDGEGACGNKTPAWFGDLTGNGQTGVWIPEEGRAITAKRFEPA